MKQEVVKTFFANAHHFKSITTKDGVFVFDFNPGFKFHSAEWKSGTAFFEEKKICFNGIDGFSQEFSCNEDLTNLSESCKIVCVHIFKDGKSALQGVEYKGIGNDMAALCFFKSCNANDGKIKSATKRSALDFDIKKSKVITYEKSNKTLD